eukprot:763670-Hanusia_phi.AAC.10
MKQEGNTAAEDTVSVTSQGSFRSASSSQRTGHMKASKMMDIKHAKLMGDGEPSKIVSPNQLRAALYEVNPWLFCFALICFQVQKKLDVTSPKNNHWIQVVQALRALRLLLHGGALEADENASEVFWNTFSHFSDTILNNLFHSEATVTVECLALLEELSEQSRAGKKTLAIDFLLDSAIPKIVEVAANGEGTASSRQAETSLEFILQNLPPDLVVSKLCDMMILGDNKQKAFCAEHLLGILRTDTSIRSNEKVHDALQACSLDASPEVRQYALECNDVILSSEAQEADALSLQRNLWNEATDANPALSPIDSPAADTPPREENRVVDLKVNSPDSKTWQDAEEEASGLVQPEQMVASCSHCLALKREFDEYRRCHSHDDTYVETLKAQIRSYDTKSFEFDLQIKNMSEIYTKAQEEIQILEERNYALNQEIARLEGLRLELSADLESKVSRAPPVTSPIAPKASLSDEEASTGLVEVTDTVSVVKDSSVSKWQVACKAPIVRVWLLLSYPLRSVLLFATRLALVYKKRHREGDSGTKLEVLPPV